MGNNLRKVVVPAVLTALAVPVAAHTTEIQKIVPGDLSAGDLFGQSVDVSGTTLCGGAPNSDAAALNAGAVYVYTTATGAWTQQAKLTAGTAAANDGLGTVVAIDGDTIAAAAPYDDDNGANSGSVFIFTRTGTAWAQQAIVKPSSGAAGDEFGVSVAIVGDTLIVGAHHDDDNGANSGSAFVFTRSGTTWTQQTQLNSSDAAAGDQFGCSVSLIADMPSSGRSATTTPGRTPAPATSSRAAERSGARISSRRRATRPRATSSARP